jgi:hypothetical protein
MEAFVELVERRNSDYKMIDQPSRADIASDLCKLYRKRFVPFLHMLGIEVAGTSSESTSSTHVHTFPSSLQSLLTSLTKTFRPVTTSERPALPLEVATGHALQVH